MNQEILDIVNADVTDVDELEAVERILITYTGNQLSVGAGDFMNKYDNTTMEKILIATGKSILYNEIERMMEFSK